jgi:fumarate reductase flavoprotein subunit
MAEEAGAALATYCTLIRHGNDSFDRESMYVPTGASGGATAIQVNTLGQRFIDEGTHVIGGNILAQQPGKIGFSIYDEEIFQGFSSNQFFGMTKQARIPIPPEKRLKLKPYLEEKNREGKWVKIADNWDDIATWIGCNPDVLKETVARYNSFCEKGYDEDFVKDKKFLVPLRNPPYYAVKFRPLVIETVGPVIVNERMEVMDKEDPTKPIPGFFAAGVIAGGWLSNDYGGTPGGTALGFSIAMGRIAAESAAKYVLSK